MHSIQKIGGVSQAPTPSPSKRAVTRKPRLCWSLHILVPALKSPQLGFFLRAEILVAPLVKDSHSDELLFSTRRVITLPVSCWQSTDSPTRKVATAKHGIVFSKR